MTKTTKRNESGSPQGETGDPQAPKRRAPAKPTTKRGPGRPRTVDGGVHVGVRIPKEDHARLITATAEDGITISEATREALTLWLDARRNNMREDTRWISITAHHNEERSIYLGDPNDESSMRSIGSIMLDAYGAWEGIPEGVAASNANPGLKDASPFKVANGLTGPSMPARLAVLPHGLIGIRQLDTESSRWRFSQTTKSRVVGRLTAVSLSGKGARREWEWALAWDEWLGTPAFLIRPMNEDAEARDLPRELREEIVSRWLALISNPQEEQSAAG